MGVTLGNTSSGSVDLATSLTVSHTAAAGDNRVLFVIVYNRGRALNTLKYDGTDMVLVTSHTGGTGFIYLYYHLNPSTSAKNVVETIVDSTGDSIMDCIDFSNVDQITPIDDSAVVDNGFNYTVSASATTVDANTYIVGGTGVDGTNNALTATSGQTIFGEEITSRPTVGGGGYELIATAGSVAMSWSQGSNRAMKAIVGAIAEAPAAAVFTPKVMMF